MWKKLDIGCGNFPREGFTGIDRCSNVDKDVFAWNLEFGLPPYIKEEVEVIWADNVLEHITNLIHLMNSCWTAMVPGGRMHIKVPLANTVGSLKDPTHVRQFVPESFDYFDLAWDYPRQPDYGIEKWKVIQKELEVESEDYKYLYVILEKP